VETVLLVLLGFFLGSIAAVLGTLWWVRWQLRRKNRVVPTQPSPAPVRWLAMPHQPARMHRRLQVAVRVVRVHAGMPDRPGRKARALTTAPSSSTVGDLVAQIEAEAHALDREITIISRAPRQVRRARLVELDHRVLHVEQLAGRVAQMAVDEALQSLPPGDPSVALDRLAEQLDSLEAARREVAEVERRAGLAEPQPQPARVPAPRPQAF
jgi:hypothetical protein